MKLKKVTSWLLAVLMVAHSLPLSVMADTLPPTDNIDKVVSEEQILEQETINRNENIGDEATSKEATIDNKEHPEITEDSAKNELVSDEDSESQDSFESDVNNETDVIVSKETTNSNLSFNSQLEQRASNTIIDSGTCGENLTWELTEDGVLTISGEGEMAERAWGNEKYKTTSVIIEDGVTSICNNAFFEFYHLESAVIPDGVTSIGHDAFFDCNSLDSITIPDSVRYIGPQAFWRCNSLRRIVIPDGVTSIGYTTFCYCTGLKYITIPDSIRSIGEEAFLDCDSLSYVYYSGTETEWDEISIESGNKKLSKLYNTRAEICFTEPTYISTEKTDGTLTLSGYAGNLVGEITLPSTIDGKTVTILGNNAIDGFGDLTALIIPKSITSIGNYAFYGCDSLTSITIPDSVTSIGTSAFRSCDSLADVYYSGTEEEWTAITIGSDNEALTGATIHFAETAPTYTYTENSDGTITLTGCEGELIGDVTLPSEIDGKTVTAIDGPFVSQNQLTSAVIPDTVIEIDNVFCDCAALESVTIPASVQSISSGDDPFRGCNALEEFILSGENHAFTFENGMLCYIDHIVHCVKSVEGEVSLPDGTAFVNHGAFNDCKNMTIINIPATVSGSKWNLYIGAFEGCTNLTTINYGGTKARWNELGVSGTVPKGVTVNCEDPVYTYTENTDGTITLTGYTGELVGNIELPSTIDGKKVTVIYRGALAKQNNITSIIVPNTVWKIESGAFGYCSGLKTLEIPDSVSSLGSGIFEGSNSLETVYFTGTTPKFVMDEGVLRNNSIILGCLASKQGTYIIPDGISEIGGGAFTDCTGLTQITMPTSMRYINNSAFRNCTGLTDIYYEGTEEQWAEVTVVEGAIPQGVEIHFTEAEETFDLTVNVVSSATLTPPADGWKEGSNTFTVSCDKACYVAISYDGGKTYNRLPATASGNAYSFTTDNVDVDTIITVGILGDVNGDGQIKAKDARLALQASSGMYSLSATQLLAVDLNGDGTVKAREARQLLQASSGMFTLTW